MRDILISIIIAVSFLSSSMIVQSAEIGKPHSTVINLKNDNFDDHLNDPANGLWLLKFYAPWCGHCKTLAPVLDAVAPFLAGKMSIGKIDCTSQKKLCNRFNVKGYPTLKYYRDGTFNDYPLGRDKDTIITFGEKMSARAVSIISSYAESKEQLLNKIPVAYIVYDPNASSSTSTGEEDSTIDSSGATEEEKAVEKLVQSTEMTRVFGQVARKLQAQGSFGMLSPSTTFEEMTKFFGSTSSSSNGIPTSGFIARIEEDVPIKLYTGEITTDALTNFVQETNLAAVIELGGHNFRFVSRRGKSVAVAVYNPEDTIKTTNFKKELKDYAVNGKYKDEYVYGIMDGIKWDKFLSQFSIQKENLPELFVLDVPNRTYWQDPSVFGVSNFITAVQNGEIESREQEKRKAGVLDEVLQAFVDYMPYSLFFVLALFGTIFWLVVRLDDGPIMPPPPPKQQKKEEGGKEVGKEKTDSGDSADKKDK